MQPDPARRWLIDGNNVMGSRPDGWWNDRPAAMARLTQEIAEWSIGHGDVVVVVFDGKEHEEVAMLAGGNLEVRFAAHRRRDAADDLIVELAAQSGRAGGGEGEEESDEAGDTVVTADRRLVQRLSANIRVMGPGRFLELVGSRRHRRDELR